MACNKCNRGKHMKKKKYLLFVLSLIFLCSAIFVFNPFSFKSTSASTEDGSLNDFLQFEQQIKDLNSEDELMLNNNETLLNNNENLLSVLSESDDSNSDLGDSLIFSDDENEESEFYLKRLIVQGNITNNFGATKDICYKNLHVLCYPTEQATAYAYEQFKKANYNVIIDKYETADSYADTDYDYTSYTDSWSAEAIDVGGFRQYLTDNNVNNEVVVAVLDTGINTSHEMFKDRLLKDENGKIVGYSYYNSTYQYSYDNLSFDSSDTSKYSFEDDGGHGTHVAGIICNLTPANVKILPIKIGNSAGRGTSTSILTGYLKVIEVYSKKYNIVSTNLSFSGAGKDSESDKNLFNKKCYEPLLALNILPITAAGNETNENNIEGLKAVVVSALEENSKHYSLADYSNYGKIVDISAPGTRINSAYISDTDSAVTDVYESLNGTSMASPQVAGAVALLNLNPSFSSLSASEIEQTLYDLSLDLGKPGYDTYYGYGMLNLKYFEIPTTQANLSFYKDGELISDEENESCINFEDKMTLTITSSDKDFQIFYTTDKTIPTKAKSLNSSIPTADYIGSYTTDLKVPNIIYLYVIGLKVVDNKIVARTNLYNISSFNINTPIEDCFEIDSDGTLTNYIGNYKELTIPGTIKGLEVKKLGYSLFKGSNLQSVTLPESCTGISGYVFKNCKDLKYIYAPGVVKIWFAGFTNCTSLTSVSDQAPPAGTTTGAYLPNYTITMGAIFFNCINLKTVSLSKLKAVELKDFYGCSSLEYVNLPAVTSIGDYGFAFCTNLTGFNIGETLETIGNGVFGKCSNLKTFTVDANNANFYTDGLGLYSKDSLVSFASGNKNIDYSILSSVTIGGTTYNITTIPEYVSSESSLTSLTIPESINYIGKFAFSRIGTLYYNAINCGWTGYMSKDAAGVPTTGAVIDNIGTIVIGENVQQVPERLFQWSIFSNVIINSYSTIFGEYCFRGEDKLKNKLVFNFDEQIDLDYLNMCADTALMMIGGINYIYAKRNDVPVESNYWTSALTYKTYDSDSGYWIYSKTKLETNSHTITTSTNGNGTITPSGNVSVNEGTSQTFTFEPNVGYRVKSVIVDGVALEGEELTNAISDGYTFTNVTENHAITVEFEIQTFTIKASAGVNGSISDVGDNEVNYGDSKKFTFTANTGYYVKSIIVDGTPLSETALENAINNGYTFTNVTQNHTISVEFEIQTFTVSASKVGGGTISPSGNISVDFGSSLTFTFTVGADYHIKSLTVDGVELTEEALVDAINNGYTFTNISENHTIKIVFEIDSYLITASAGDNGAISPSGSVPVDAGANQTFTFTPDIGYKIGNIQVDGEDLGEIPSYTFKNVKEQHTISVSFVKIVSTITATSGKNGTISSSGTQNIEYGETVNYTFTPNTGYKVKDVLINGESKGAIESYTFSNVLTDQTIHVEFEKKVLTINVICGEHGSIAPTGTNGVVNVEYGDSITFTITPDEGYGIDYIKLNDVEIDIKDTIVFGNVTENQKIEVVFTNSYLISSDVSAGNGTITQSTMVGYGDSVTFTITPDEGYNIKDVKIDGVSVGAVSSYIFTNVKKVYTISVEFEIKKFNITVNVEGQGNLSCDSTLENVPYGESRVFTISAYEGWEFNKVYVNEEVIDVSNNALTISQIDKDITIRAVFTEKVKEPVIEPETDNKTTTNSVDTTTIAIICGSAVFALLLAGVLIKVFKNKNRKTAISLSTPNETINNVQPQPDNAYSEPSQPQPANYVEQVQDPWLLQARNFAQSRQNDFIAFCNRYSLDYSNNYDKAVSSYYRAYLKYLQSKNPSNKN